MVTHEQALQYVSDIIVETEEGANTAKVKSLIVNMAAYVAQQSQYTDALERRLGAAYQIVGALADYADVFELEIVDQALSYLNLEDVPSPLPFIVPDTL